MKTDFLTKVKYLGPPPQEWLTTVACCPCSTVLDRPNSLELCNHCAGFAFLFARRVNKSTLRWTSYSRTTTGGDPLRTVISTLLFCVWCGAFISRVTRGMFQPGIWLHSCLFVFDCMALYEGVIMFTLDQGPGKILLHIATNLILCSQLSRCISTCKIQVIDILFWKYVLHSANTHFL